MRLKLSLRHQGGGYNDATTFELPVLRVWWEDVDNDLHIQFEGFDGENICPDDNARQGEVVIPKDATVFAAWYKKKFDETITKKMTISSCMLEGGKARKRLMPSPEATADLIKHWVSPNRSEPKKCF